MPSYTLVSLPTPTNTCLTSGFSPHPSVTLVTPSIPDSQKRAPTPPTHYEGRTQGPRPALHLEFSRCGPSPPARLHPLPHSGNRARREPGVTRVGSRARRARLTKSGAAPCGRATRDPADNRARGRDLGPGSDLTLLALSGPGRARCPILPENTPPFGPGSAGRRETPAPCARRCRAPATGAAGERPGWPRRPSLSSRLPFAAGCPDSGAAAPRDQARAPPPPRTGCNQAGACIQPRAPRLTLGAGGGEDRRAAAAKAAAAAAARRAPVWSTVERSAEELRGAAPTMAELRYRAPRPPRPSGSG